VEIRRDFQGRFWPVFSTALLGRFISLFLFHSFLFYVSNPRASRSMGVVHQAVEDPSASVGSPICSCQRDTGRFAKSELSSASGAILGSPRSLFSPVPTSGHDHHRRPRHRSGFSLLNSCRRLPSARARLKSRTAPPPRVVDPVAIRQAFCPSAEAT